MASKNNIFKYNKETKEFKINAHFTFDFYQKYGFPVELLQEEANSRFKDRKDLKAYHLAVAYDEEMGTNYADKFIDIVKEVNNFS